VYYYRDTTENSRLGQSTAGNYRIRQGKQGYFTKGSIIGIFFVIKLIIVRIPN